MHAELQLKTNEISQAKVDAASSAKQAAHSAGSFIMTSYMIQVDISGGCGMKD